MFRLTFETSEPSVLGGWSNPFLLEMRFTISGDSLIQEFSVVNTGTEEFSFTTALHSYFSVNDISNVRVVGLSGNRYLDSLEARVEETDDDEAVLFGNEVDRIYLNVPRELSIQDGESKSILITTSASLGDAVVWNPWVEKSKRMPDFGDSEYQKMVCVEVAQCIPAVNLGAGETWTGMQSLRTAVTSS